ncbi:MAG: YqaJ viral recombinase family protein [Ignavibacteria bacterium]|nr:YqaJ viral recombinase family protein [Ignavibacteria bacterium]
MITIGAGAFFFKTMLEEINITSQKRWREARRSGIGGSDIAALMGVNPFATAEDVYRSKVEGYETPETEQMRIGKRIEAFTVREFKRLKPEFTILNPKRLYKRGGIFLATPDRLLSVGSSEAHAVLEIKNAAYWSKDKRTMAAYQVQWYLFVLGMKFGYICALEQGWKLHVQPIVRDEELIERMKDTAQAFWEKIGGKVGRSGKV